MGKIKKKKRAGKPREFSEFWNHISVRYGSHPRKAKWGCKGAYNSRYGITPFNYFKAQQKKLLQFWIPTNNPNWNKWKNF